MLQCFIKEGIRMVYLSFMGGLGAAVGEDDRTTLMYDKKDCDTLKNILDKFKVTIFRDGDSPDEKDLELLIRKNERGIVELIPVQGAVAMVETPRSDEGEGVLKYRGSKEFMAACYFEVGETVTIGIYYSLDDYLRLNEEEKLKIGKVIKETRGGPIVIDLPSKLD